MVASSGTNEHLHAHQQPGRVAWASTEDSPSSLRARTDRAALTEHLARLLVRAADDAPTELVLGGRPRRPEAAAAEAAVRRVEVHERVRGELAAKLRRARELQAVTANRRDEAAARARRMSAHLADCDSLLERAGELTNAAEEARRTLDARRAEVETARGKLALVDEQREAARPDDRRRQRASSAELETSELDETALRRELEAARMGLADAEEAHGEAGNALREVEQEAANRAATRDHVLFTRANLVARVEAPMRRQRAGARRARRLRRRDAASASPTWWPASWPASGSRSTASSSASSPPCRRRPSADELAAAERRLAQIEQTIADLESASRRCGPGARRPRRDRGGPRGRARAAEEDVDQSGGHEDDMVRLHQAREVEHAVLRRHGYETYLDVILAGPRPAGDAQADLLDALRARRVAEDSLASLRAATEPPAIVTTLRGPPRPHLPGGRRPARLRPRRQRRRAALRPSRGPAQPDTGAGDGAGQLRDPAGRRVGARGGRVAGWSSRTRTSTSSDECRREIARLDRDLVQLDDDDVRAREHAEHAPGGAERHATRTSAAPCTGSACWRTSCPTGRPTTSGACSASPPPSSSASRSPP